MKKEEKIIGILGPQYTNSDLSFDSYKSNKKVSYKKLYFPTIAKIFQALKKEEIQRAVVPFENSITGTVTETGKNILQGNFRIVDRFTFAIRYALVCLSEAKETDIKNITSHEQALLQCKKYLHKKYPDAILISCSSTMTAFENVVKNKSKNTAVIIPLESAKKLNIKILEEGIEDNKKNETTFIVIELTK